MYPYQANSASGMNHGQANGVTAVVAYHPPTSPHTTQPATAFPSSPRDANMYSPPHPHVHSPQASAAQGPTMSYRSQQTSSAPQITMHTQDGQQLLYSPPPASQRPYGTASKNKQGRPHTPSRIGGSGRADESGKESGRESETERGMRSRSGSRGHHSHHSSRHRNYESDRSEGRSRERTRDRYGGYQSSSSARSSTPAQQSSRSSTPIAGHQTQHSSSHRHNHSHSHGHSGAEAHTNNTGQNHPHYLPTYSTAAPAQPQQVFQPASTTGTQVGATHPHQQMQGNTTGSRSLQTTHTQQPQPQPQPDQTVQPHNVLPQPTTTTTTAAPVGATGLTQHPVNVFSTVGGPTGIDHQAVLNGKSTSQISTQQGQQMVVTFNANGESQLVSLDEVKQQQLANAQANIQHLANRTGYQHLNFTHPYTGQQFQQPHQQPASTVSGGTQPAGVPADASPSQQYPLQPQQQVPQQAPQQAPQQVSQQVSQQGPQQQENGHVQQPAAHKTPSRPSSRQQDVTTPSSHSAAYSAPSRDTKVFSS